MLLHLAEEEAPVSTRILTSVPCSPSCSVTRGSARVPGSLVPIIPVIRDGSSPSAWGSSSTSAPFPCSLHTDSCPLGGETLPGPFQNPPCLVLVMLPGSPGHALVLFFFSVSFFPFYPCFYTLSRPPHLIYPGPLIPMLLTSAVPSCYPQRIGSETVTPTPISLYLMRDPKEYIFSWQT